LDLKMSRKKFVFLCLAFLILLPGCSEQKTEPLEGEKVSPPKEVKVIVPETVEGKWRSVKIALQDLQEGTEAIYRVDIGGSFQIPGTGQRVTVETFMPAFAANSERVTSVSNEPTNPAVLIVVREGGKEIHRGWVFSLYPERQHFENDRYKFILREYK